MAKILSGVTIFLVSTGIITLIVTPFIVHYEINWRMKLRNGSTLYDEWSRNRSGTFVEFYFFTVKNIDDFLAGQIPNVEQVGPYTYEATTSKVGLRSFPMNGTLTYADRNTYQFLPSRSVGKESDVVLVLNLGYVGIAEQAGKHYFIDWLAWRLIKHYYNAQLFLNKTVYEMIWGYEDPALKAISHFVSIPTKIGLFTDKNNTAGGAYEINDGVADTLDVGKIVTYKGRHNLTVWKSPGANTINGSDGSIFPPFLNINSSVHVFSPDICQSLNFHPGVNAENEFINHVPTKRFRLSNKTFLSPQDYPDNQGFCLDYPNCPKSGVIDMRVCMNGSPIAISLPHFNKADKSYREAVHGMRPSADMDISINVELQTGVVLRALQMVQVNAMMHNNPYFPQLANLPQELFLPVGYINTTILVDQSVADTLLSTLYTPQTVSLVIGSICLVVGVVLLTILIAKCCLAWRNRRRQLRDGMTALLNDEDSLPVVTPVSSVTPQPQSLVQTPIAVTPIPSHLQEGRVEVIV